MTALAVGRTSSSAATPATWSTAANADVGALGYMTNSRVRSKLRRTQMFGGTNGLPVWSSLMGADGMSSLAGYKAAVSNQVPNTLTKGTSSGVCSAILFGNWADLLIGLWSSIDILLDPYSLSTQGALRVTAFIDADIAVRHPESFAAMLDALTV